MNTTKKPRDKFQAASSDWRHWQKQKQLRAYSNGEALNHHMVSAHKGEFDPACAACNQLRLRHDHIDRATIHAKSTHRGAS